MFEPIVSRARIAEQAQEAARQHIAGRRVTNPYPDGSAAHLEWHVTFERATVPEDAEACA